MPGAADRQHCRSAPLGIGERTPYVFAASRARTSAIQLCVIMSWLLSVLLTIRNCETAAETS